MNLIVLLVIMGLMSLIFFYLPLFNMIYSSFFDPYSIGDGFSLKWYKAVLCNEEIMQCTLTSLKLATLSATFAIIIGVFLNMGKVFLKHSIAHTGLSKKWMRFFENLLLVPNIVSDVIFALGMMLFFYCLDRLNIKIFAFSGFTKVLIAHTTLGLGFVCMVIDQKLKTMDMSIQEAALDLGVKPHVMFCVVVLPLLKSALIMGWFFVFIISLDDVIIASMIGSGSMSTLPQYIVSNLRLGTTPIVDALSVLMMFVASCVIFIGFKLIA